MRFRRFRPRPFRYPIRRLRAHKQYFQTKKPSKLAQAIDNFIRNQELLDHLRDNHSTWTISEKRQFRQARNDIMKFNDLIRLIITKKNGRISFSQLETHFIDTYIAHRGHHDLERVKELIHSVLVGMRHEVSFARVLDFTGIPYRHGSDNEDRHGDDFILNGRIGIDVKASEFNAEKERAAARQRGYDDAHIFYSGIKPEDYNDQLILPNTQAKALAKSLFEFLYTLAHSK